MKRYKLVNRGGGQVTLMDTEGNLTFVNEGVFRDAYTKVKDFVKSKVAKFEEIGGRIVAYIDGIVAKAITVFDIAKQNEGIAFLFATGKSASMASDFGVKVYNIEDVPSICGDEDPYDAIYLALDTAFVGLTTRQPITEAEHVLSNDTPEARKNLAATIFAMNSDEEGDVASSFDSIKDAKGQAISDVDYNLSTRLFASGRYVDATSAKKAIEEHIRSVFTREYHTGSYSFTSRDSRGNKDIDNPRIGRIPLLYSIGGVGKTAIIESVIDDIFKEEVGTDDGGKLYRVDRSTELDPDDVDQYSDLMNKPTEDNGKLIFVKCQGLSQDDIYMPAKDTRGITIHDKSGKEYQVAKEAVRGTSTGLIPLIDTVNMTNEEIEAADRAFGNIVIVFDELFMARPDAMNVLMSFAKERRINSWVLPTRCAIIATTNRYEDFEDGYTRENIKEVLTDQYKDRFNIMPYFMTYPEWREWAVSLRTRKTPSGLTVEIPNIDPVIISFLDQISNRFRFLNVFRPKDLSDLNINTGHSSPRAWTGASNEFVQTYKDYKKRIDAARGDDRRMAIIDFLDELKGKLDSILTIDDSAALTKHVRTELFGVPNETMKSMWTTKYTDKIVYKDTIDGSSKQLTDSTSGLAPQMLLNRLFANCPIKFSDINNVNSSTTADMHENLVSNLKIYFGTDITKLKSFTKMFMIRLLKVENNLMVENGYYHNNISDQEKIEIILGRIEGDNGKEMVKLSAWKQYFDKFSTNVK